MPIAKISDVMKFPRVVRLERNLYALAFDLLKIVPAKYVIEQALLDGRIGPDSMVAETSSGTYALGMGIVCAENGLRFAIFSDPAIDADLKRRLEDLGGQVHIVDADPTENPQLKRLAELQRFLDAHQAFWSRQYDSSENRVAYHEVADYIAAEIGKPFDLVGTVGSGSSTCGLAEGLRRHQPDARLIGIDTFNSVLFGLNNGKRILRGLGNSLQPLNLIHEYFDEIHWLDHRIAYDFTRAMHRRTGIFAGPTTGAAYAVARHLAQTHPDRNYAFVAADSGHRYMRCAYGYDLPPYERDSEPQQVRPVAGDAPPTQTSGWHVMQWGRRPLADVVGAELAA